MNGNLKCMVQNLIFRNSLVREKSVLPQFILFNVHVQVIARVNIFLNKHYGASCIHVCHYCFFKKIKNVIINFHSENLLQK